MGLYRFEPEASGRMGILWTVGTIGESVVIEFGSMGHTLYSQKWMSQTGINNRAKIVATHISEKEIALGITKRLENAVEEIVKKENPKAIFILPSTVPETIGMDIPAVCEELQSKYEQIPIITFQKGGFREKLHHGVEEALLQIVKNIPKQIEKSKTPTFNIIGSCVDFARFEADVEEIKRILRGALHMEVCCILTSNTTISQIEQMGQAHINLVIRREGTLAAKRLQQEFDTPYWIGRPYGLEGTKDWLYGISKCLNLEIDEQFIHDEIAESRHQYSYFKQILPYLNHQGRFSIGTHIDIVEGVCRFAEELGMKKEYAWCQEKAYANEMIPYFSEEQWMERISPESTTIIMGSKVLIEQTKGNQNYIFTRGLNSWNFNPYVSPYVGFRGARNLCDLWMQEI